jgi:chaperone modulatory protein CbpM
MKSKNGYQGSSPPYVHGVQGAQEAPGSVADTPELSGTLLDDQHLLTVEDVCRVCAVRIEYIEELVEEGLITPQVEQVDALHAAKGHELQSWRFTGMHMRQARIAAHLQSDLGINLAGVALALQLLDEVEVLRMRVKAIDAT